MKHYNQTHEVTIESNISATYSRGIKAGDIVPHKETVKSIYFFHPIRDPKTGCVLHYHKIDLDRNAVMDLAEHIQKIESVVQNLPYESDLPF